MPLYSCLEVIFATGNRHLVQTLAGRAVTNDTMENMMIDLFTRSKVCKL